ncbi:hypothetical protein KY363_01805 [Candidatus Woesearchaeota archaeon]|nr:hypothetical protein [Candidatus Woesearchaeota archaeon]
MDKAKFWKKNEEDLGDLSDLGDFGLDDKSPSSGGPDLGGPLPSFDEPSSLDAHGPEMHTEDVQPSPASRQMGDQFGLGAQQPTRQPQQPPPRQPMQQMPPMQQPQQQYYESGPGMSELTKDIEIIHAKLDAIKASLDSINQRLASLERIAYPEQKNRYSW